MVLEMGAKLVNFLKTVIVVFHNLHFCEQELFSLLSSFYNLPSIFKAEKCLVKDNKRQR